MREAKNKVSVWRAENKLAGCINMRALSMVLHPAVVRVITAEVDEVVAVSVRKARSRVVGPIMRRRAPRHSATNGNQVAIRQAASA